MTRQGCGATGRGEWGIVMDRIVRLKRAFAAAHAMFGSASCTELAQIAIFSLLGMIASALVITPSDHHFIAIYRLCARIAACS